MAAITIATSVILPARHDSANSEALPALAAQTTSSPNGVAAVMSITVVAAREPRSSTAPRRVVQAASRPEAAVETAPSIIFRVSSAAQ
jgi:hypothetical protein